MNRERLYSSEKLGSFLKMEEEKASNCCIPVPEKWGVIKTMKGLINKSYLATQIIIFIFAFFAYFACYAYRKPFSVSDFPGLKMWGVDFKIMLVTFQVIGYTLSKFIGIVFISVIDMKKRSFWIIGLILVRSHADFLWYCTRSIQFNLHVLEWSSTWCYVGSCILIS